MYRSYKITSVGEIGTASVMALRLKDDVDRTTLLPWIEALKQASTLDPWEKEPRRQDRPRWREYLTQAERLLAEPRKQRNQEVVTEVLRGELGQSSLDMTTNKNKVLVFISSTFTDTQAERNSLMRDVYPFLRILCRQLGLEFDCVDMRWGVSEEMSLAHSTTELCLLEIDRCLKESAGPAFLAMLGNKYGYRPFPSQIEKEEFEAIITELKKQKHNYQILLDWFKIDYNSVPPEYVLLSRQKTDGSWWDKFEAMKKLLRTAAEKCLSPKDREKYFISVTENEISRGLFTNKNAKAQGMAVVRDLKDCHDTNHHHRHLVDMVESKIDEDAATQMKAIKEKKIVEKCQLSYHGRTEYQRPSISDVLSYVKDVSDDLCDHMATAILDNYKHNLHVEQDGLFHEVCQHRSTAIDKSRSFVGRQRLLNQIMDTLNNPGTEGIVCLNGTSGCGKTACMAKTATLVKSNLGEKGIVVTRLVGTTGGSASARAVLYSICEQITRVLGKDTKEIPVTYKDLIEHFWTCLKYATEEFPIYVFIDSLDQLSNDDFGMNLKWLPHERKLPAFCRVIVSTLPGDCLDILSGLKSKVVKVQVNQLSADDGPEILDKMLQDAQRCLTEAQRNLILRAFTSCPLPLYLRLATDVALTWKSFDDVKEDSFAPDMPGLIHKLFERLETMYGKLLVEHALGYITAAKNGLSAVELEDVLSCDDEVLDSVYVYFTPPLRRIPPVLWIRIRNSLGQYLVERGSDGVSTYAWYHRQFWETAEKRYLSGDFRQVAHKSIADYFEGKHVGGKWFTPTSKAKDQASKALEPEFEDRKVSEQPVLIAGSLSTSRVLNKRKLSELSYNLLCAKDWDRFEHLVSNFEFLEAKFAAEQGYTCQAEFVQASKLSDRPKIKALMKFLGAGLSFMVRESQAIYQLASQQVLDSVVHTMFTELLPKVIPPLVTDHDRVEIEDPCILTMTGHTSSIRNCEFSPDGSLIASTSEDSTLRLWDPLSGAEVVTVSDLPGPVKSMDTSDVGSGFRPCCFTRDGNLVLTGSESGHVQAWSLKGALMFEHHIGNAAGAVGLCVSPCGQYIATANRDRKARIFKLQTGITEVCSVELGLPGLGCSFSPDGTKLAVSCYGRAPSMVLIDTASHKVLSAQPGHTGYNICLAYSPRGDAVVTAGDNSSISLWSTDTWSPVTLIQGHRGWIWGLRYNQDATFLFSSSSDRTLKIWNAAAGYTCLVSLGGHLHRVSWSALRPGTEDVFVTCSLDMSLKLWDTEAVVAKRVPPVGGLHYNIVRVSPTRRYLAISQGWMTNCNFVNLSSNQQTETYAHPGFIHDAGFVPDSEVLVYVDTGHKGSYEPGMSQYARVSVCSPDEGAIEMLSGLECPCRVAASREYIFVGSDKGVVAMYSANDYKLLTKMSVTEDEIFALGASLDNCVAVGSGEYVTVLKSRNGNSLERIGRTAKHDATLRKCVFSPDNKHLASGTYRGTVYVWNAQDTFTLLHKLSVHRGTVLDLVYSPSGAYLCSSGVEMSLRVWSVANNYKQAAAYYGPVSQFGFTDEQTVVAGLSNGNRKRLSFPL